MRVVRNLNQSHVQNGLLYTTILKSSRNKKDLNDVTAAPFSVSFSQLPAAKKKPPKTGQL